jgi:hypothetical protein
MEILKTIAIRQLVYDSKSDRNLKIIFANFKFSGSCDLQLFNDPYMVKLSVIRTNQFHVLKKAIRQFRVEEVIGIVQRKKATHTSANPLDLKLQSGL